MYNIIIIGAGVTGAFIARKLSQYNLKVLLLDKETDVGNVTSNANSAIIHSGYDPIPGTLKARLNVAGNAMFDEIARDLQVDFFRIGSLTVAINDEQLEVLKQLEKRSKDNGVETKLISKEELFSLEPNVNPNALGALFAPTAGIIDPFNLVVHAVENAVDNGVELRLSETVIDIQNDINHFIVKTNKNEYESEIVINAAGLGGEKIARMIDDDLDWSLIPRKGEYFVLDKFHDKLVSHTIFPLPSEKGKGVLVSPTSSNNVIVGPSSEITDNIDDFSTDFATLMKVRKQSLDLIPSIPFNKVIRVFAGIRASSTRHDFILEQSKNSPNFINVAGIESPGLVSAPAIAEYVFDIYISKLINCVKKSDYNPKIKPYVRLSDLPLEKRNALISQNRNYGFIVCNCEYVSLGEIEDLLSRSVAPHTVKAVKKRVRAGFGRCQGSFCGPKVALLLAEHYKISPLEVALDKEDSEILVEEVKLCDK